MTRWMKAFAPTGIASLLLVGTAIAALSVSYTTPSSQTLGVAAVPVIFQNGADSGSSAYVSGFSTSTNATRFSVTLNGVPEATLTVDELAKIKNQAASAASAVITTTQVVNANILVYKLEVYNGASLVGALDFLAASPSVNLGSIPAGTTYTVKAIIQLASGAGNDNVNVQRDLTLSVTV